MIDRSKKSLPRGTAAAREKNSSSPVPGERELPQKSHTPTANTTAGLVRSPKTQPVVKPLRKGHLCPVRRLI